MKEGYRFLLGLHIFVGIGAMFGGLAAILDPQDPLGMPVEAMKNSPFSSYLIPGIILFTILGLGHITSSVTLFLKLRYQAYFSSVFNWALMIWIVVQCIMLNDVHFLHVFYFIVGGVGAVLSMKLLFEQRLFPTNLLLKLYKAYLVKESRTNNLP